MSGAGRLAVISGPSGSGKTTICRALLGDPRVVLSTSATTRAKRKGEVEGRDYYFLGVAEFERAVEKDEFLEWAEYNGNRYGTLKAEVHEKMSRGKVVILEIEVQGTRHLRDQGAEGTFIFIMPPSIDELEQRLRSRKTEKEDVILRRLAIAREEMDMAHLYDHIVINDDLSRAVQEVRAVLGLASDGRSETT